MAGTCSSPIVIDEESSSEVEASLTPLKADEKSLSPLKVVKSRAREYRRILRDLSSDHESESEVPPDEADCVEVSQDQPSCKKTLFSDVGDGSSSSSASNPNTPVFDVPRSQYSVEKVISMLLEPCDDSLICTERPTDIRSSATFVMNLDKLKHSEDAKRDNFGKWKPSGSHTIPFQSWFADEGDVQVERLPIGASGPDVQYLRRMHYVHPSDSRCKRMLAYITDANGDLHHLCIASYRFPKGVVPKATPHGNSKSNTPFHPTWYSAMEEIKDKARSHGPKETVARVSDVFGGVMHASSSGQLPRDEHQVANVRYRGKKTTGACAGDELFIAMSECKSKDVTARFVRDVKAAPEPAVVLATDQQLTDLVRFCTNPDEFCVVTVDPTFNLGDFDVTPLTYRHLMLKSNRTGKHPVFLGPLLIHFRKNFPTFLYFASTLVGLCRDLERLKAFGTDGEEALIDAFSHEFGFAVHLSCSIHLRRNVKQQLQDRNFPDELRKVTLEEIFGGRRGSVYVEGLIDTQSCAEFDEKLAALESTWKARESSDPRCKPGFFEWFQEHKAEVIKTSAIAPVREEAGLGSPPEPFTTNASESINAVIKSKCDYQKNELHKFIDKMKCLVDDQQKEVERAVCRRGKYALRSNYRFLEVSEDRWFALTPESRSKHMTKVNSRTVIPDEVSCRSPGGDANLCQLASSPKVSASTAGCSDSLSVELESFSSRVCTPNAVLEGIWKKARELVGDPSNLVPAPGCSPLARMVVSKTGSRPHLVTPGKDGKFACDSECANFKSLGICSHVVATAEVNHKLAAFITFFEKQKKMPNLTSLAKVGVPKGRGRKGGVPPRKRMKSSAPEKRIPFDPVVTVAGACTSASSTPSQSVLPEPLSSAHTSLSYPSAHLYQPPPLPQSPFLQPGLMSTPPPLVSFQQAGMNTQSGMWNIIVSQSAGQPPNPGCADLKPFKLHFISGNIARCAGCKGKYSKPALPPADLCVQHEEWRSVTFPNSPSPTNIFSNAYYHPNPLCIQANWPQFIPASLVIPPNVHASLRPEHWSVISSAFGLYATF